MKILFRPVSVTVVGLLMLVSLFSLPMPGISAQDNAPAVPTSATVMPNEDAAVIVIPAEEIPIATDSPLVYGILGVLAILLVAAMIYSGTITRYLATLVPPETASAIYASGVRFGLQVALNQAAQTPNTLDDEFFVEMARLRGLTVTRRIDGSYEVTQNLNHKIPTMPV